MKIWFWEQDYENLHLNNLISSSLKFLYLEDLLSFLVSVGTLRGIYYQHDILMQSMVLQKIKASTINAVRKDWNKKSSGMQIVCLTWSCGSFFKILWQIWTLKSWIVQVHSYLQPCGWMIFLNDGFFLSKFDCGMFRLEYIDFYSRALGLCFNQVRSRFFLFQQNDYVCVLFVICRLFNIDLVFRSSTW